MGNAQPTKKAQEHEPTTQTTQQIVTPEQRNRFDIMVDFAQSAQELRLSYDRYLETDRGRAILARIVNGFYRESKTPLMLRIDDPDMVQTLLNYGADVNIYDSRGQTALFYATNPQVMDLLLNAGADINFRNNRNETVLLVRSRPDNSVIVEMPTNDDINVLRFLLERGADPNIQDSDGNTALINAVQWEFYDYVELLLSHGASPTLRNKEGRTALDIVLRRSERRPRQQGSRHNKIINLLRNAERQEQERLNLQRVKLLSGGRHSHENKQLRGGALQIDGGAQEMKGGSTEPFHQGRPRPVRPQGQQQTLQGVVAKHVVQTMPPDVYNELTTYMARNPPLVPTSGIILPVHQRSDQSQQQLQRGGASVQSGRQQKQQKKDKKGGAPH